MPYVDPVQFGALNFRASPFPAIVQKQPQGRTTFHPSAKGGTLVTYHKGDGTYPADRKPTLSNAEMKRITAERFGLTQYDSRGQRMRVDPATGQLVRWGI